MAEQQLSAKTYLAYGAPALPLALVAITFYVYLPKFFADVAGVSLATIGTIVLISRVWDAVIDPLMGSISDRTTSRFGRRRPWMMFAALPCGLCFFLLCAPDIAPDTMSPALWIGVCTFLFFLFWTILVVPFEALGAEISFDYDERNKLFSFREGALVLGTLLAGAIPFILESTLPELSASKRYFYLGIAYSVLLVVATTYCVTLIQEREWSDEKKPSGNPFRGLGSVLRNRPFAILISAYTIGAFGGALPATLILFYVEHVLGSDQGSMFLCLYFLIGFVCLPLWIKLAERYGKKEAWLLALLINTGAFSAVFFLGQGDVMAYGILVSLSAIGYGATLALPASMQADVIDYDEWQNGKRREGQFIGLWSIAKKLSAALGAGVAFQVLDATGYRADATQNEQTIFALRTLYAAVPSVCSFIAIAVAWRYPITREMHTNIRNEVTA